MTKEIYLERLEKLLEGMDPKEKEVSEDEIESKIDAMADDAMKSGNIAVNPRSSRKQDIVALYYKAL